MFKSKGLFSDVACPYSEDCVLPNCLFAHGIKPAPKASSPIPGSSSSVTEGKPTVQSASLDDGQRKRRRIDDEASVETQISEKEKNAKPAQKNENDAAVKPGHRTTPPLTSEKKAISPPPIRRPNAAAPASAPNPAQASAKHSTVPQQKPLKAESLNPRLLKHSPATHDLRLRLVKTLHEQLVRLNSELAKDASDRPLVISAQGLVTMALDIEEKVALEKPAVHSHSVKNIILRYKKMAVADWKKERQTERDAEISKLQEKEGTKPAVAPPPAKPIDTGLPAHLELALLPKLCTPLTNLSEHGYVTEVPSEESIATAKAGLSAAKGWEVCDRCNTRFQAFPGRRESDGLLTSGGSCTYHWGKAFYPTKSSSDVKGTKRERRYKCCGQAIGDSPGCTKASNHIYKVTEVKRLASLLNFIKTPDNEGADEDRPVCFDGEMGYTVHGLELIRLTATSWPSGSPVFDVLVRPFGEILDLNSRWSGVLASQMADAPPLVPDPNTQEYDPAHLEGREKLHMVESPAAARELLVRFLTPKTIVIGHGLENDLNSVRLVHSAVIDTALLFPHRAGLPYRNALRSLALTHLGRTIQSGGGTMPSASAAGGEADGGVVGHDSKEDANAAGDLVRWAVGREWTKMQQIGWSVADGKLVPPSRISVDFLEEKQPSTPAAGQTKRKAD